ncbi:hypothetical protein BH11PLA2_BH11PLA2_04960 [soil metagenome]
MPAPEPQAPTVATPESVAARKKPSDQELISSIPLGPPLKPSDLGSLGPYRIIRLIGRGGMGMVFLGVDPKLRRKVALKVMLPKFLAKPAARDRFFREARALAAVKNDHIVTIYQVDDANGTPYLALEYLLGSTLEEFIRGGHELSMAQRVHIAREVATGLAAAHDNNVIHRDIKPENIWLEAPDGRVKLIDFGLARIPVQSSNVTAEGTVMGTPAYMSPEQAKGHESDARSDLFSLGAVIYRLIAGRIPFKGETPFATVLALSNDPHVPLMIENPQTSQALSLLVDRLLAKTPDGRPSSAKEVAKELKRIESLIRQGDSGVVSDHPGRQHQAMVIPVNATNHENAWAGLDTENASATPSQSSRIAPPPKPRDYTPYYWIGGAVIVAAVALYFGLTSGHKSAPASTAPESPTRRPINTKTVSTPTPKPPDPFVPLFSGKDITGWIPVTEGQIERWKVAEPLLMGDESLGKGPLLITEKEYTRFELRLDYRWPHIGGDAGILLYLNEAGNNGIEVQLVDDSDPKTIKGIRQFLGNKTIYRHGAFLGLKPAKAMGHRGSGDWNTLKITSTGTKITVEENGTIINEFDYTALYDKKNFKEKHPGLGAGTGHIGLQCLYGSVEFRNIKIKEQ